MRHIVGTVQSRTATNTLPVLRWVIDKNLREPLLGLSSSGTFLVLGLRLTERHLDGTIWWRECEWTLTCYEASKTQEGHYLLNMFHFVDLFEQFSHGGSNRVPFCSTQYHSLSSKPKRRSHKTITNVFVYKLQYDPNTSTPNFQPSS